MFHHGRHGQSDGPTRRLRPATSYGAASKLFRRTRNKRGAATTPPGRRARPQSASAVRRVQAGSSPPASPRGGSHDSDTANGSAAGARQRADVRSQALAWQVGLQETMLCRPTSPRYSEPLTAFGAAGRGALRQRVASHTMRALRGIEQSTPGLRPLLRHVRESLRVLIFSDVPAGLSSRDNSSTRSGDSGSGLGVKHRPYRDVVERTLRRLEEVCGARDDAVARAEATEAAVNTLRTTLVACNQKEATLADQLREKRMQCEQLAEAVVAEANRRKAEKQQFEATIREMGRDLAEARAALAVADERAVELEDVRSRANEAKDRFRHLELKRAAAVLGNFQGGGAGGNALMAPVSGKVFMTTSDDTGSLDAGDDGTSDRGDSAPAWAVVGTSIRDTLMLLVNKRMREYEALTASLPVDVIRRNHQRVFHVEMQEAVAEILSLPSPPAKAGAGLGSPARRAPFPNLPRPSSDDEADAQHDDDGSASTGDAGPATAVAAGSDGFAADIAARTGVWRSFSDHGGRVPEKPRHLTAAFVCSLLAKMYAAKLEEEALEDKQLVAGALDAHGTPLHRTARPTYKSDQCLPEFLFRYLEACYGHKWLAWNMAYSVLATTCRHRSNELSLELFTRVMDGSLGDCAWRYLFELDRVLTDVGNVATRAGLALAAARLYGTGSAAARGNVVASSEGARVGAAMEARHDQLRTWGKWADQVLMVCSVAGGVSLTKARLRNYLVQQIMSGSEHRMQRCLRALTASHVVTAGGGFADVALGPAAFFDVVEQTLPHVHVKLVAKYFNAAVTSARVSRYAPVPVSRLALAMAYLDIIHQPELVRMEEQTAAAQRQQAAAARAAEEAQALAYAEARSLHNAEKARMMAQFGLTMGDDGMPDVGRRAERARRKAELEAADDNVSVAAAARGRTNWARLRAHTQRAADHVDAGAGGAT